MSSLAFTSNRDLAALRKNAEDALREYLEELLVKNRSDRKIAPEYRIPDEYILLSLKNIVQMLGAQIINDLDSSEKLKGEN